MENINLGKRLKLARTNKEYTQQQLAEIIGVTKQAVTNYETNKRNPSSMLLIKLCDALDVSMDYLFGMNKATPNPLRNLDSEVENLSTGNVEIPGEENDILLPLFESAAAGIGAEPLSEPVDFIPKPIGMKGDAWVIIRGDSMQPRILNGDRVLLDKKAIIKNNDIVIALVDGQVYCKYFYKDSEGNITLYSHTTAYPPIRKNGEIQFEIIGKVVGFFAKI